MQAFKSATAVLLSILLVLAHGAASARFLSVDPVQPDTATGQGFNRYNYANNNPYRFHDPDGRQSRELNFETVRSGYTPPPRSPDDWLGPSIGVGLSGVLAAPVIGFGGSALLAKPLVASRLFGAAADIGMGDAMGGASLAAGGATLFRVVDNVELRSLQATGHFLPSPNGDGIKRFLDNLPHARVLAAKYGRHWGEHWVVQGTAPVDVMKAAHMTEFSDTGTGAMRSTNVPSSLVHNVKCQGHVDGC